MGDILNGIKLIRVVSHFVNDLNIAHSFSTFVVDIFYYLMVIDTLLFNAFPSSFHQAYAGILQITKILFKARGTSLLDYLELTRSWNSIHLSVAPIEDRVMCFIWMTKALILI